MKTILSFIRWITTPTTQEIAMEKAKREILVKIVMAGGGPR